MKIRLLISFMLGISFSAITIPVYAQTPLPSPDTSQSDETSVVTGFLVNRSPGGSIPESLPVMLHVLDQNYNQLNMLHTQFLPDGSFRFDDVPLHPGEYVAGITSYQGATYYSQPVAFDGELSPKLELPIYESTKGLFQVRVDELHVLFNFAQDGLEVSEIYLLSNKGYFTVTGTLTLDDGQPASIKFPLPVSADYVFFKPDSPDRFVKLKDGFADKAPLLPGESSSNIMVSYLLPYSDQMSYSYTAPVSVGYIDYLVPAESGMLIDGQNITGPETKTFQDSSVYQVYSYTGLPSGKTVSFRFLGELNIETNIISDTKQTKAAFPGSKLAIEIGSGVVGMAMIAVGVWQWRKSRADVPEEEDIGDKDEGLYDVVANIAQLDEAHERGEINDDDYNRQRADLREQGKTLLEEIDE